MSSFVSGWLQKQTIDLEMAACLREIGEHKGRSELYDVHTLAIVESLRAMTAEHSAASVNRLGGVNNPVEQVNYCNILLETQGNLAQMPLKAETIKGIHARLFKDTGLPEGEFLKQMDQVAVEKLCDSYRKLEESVDPVLLIGTFMLDFFYLQPFAEGNGRVAQLTAAWLLQRQGYNVSCFVSLERIMEETKAEYVQALKKSAAGWQQSRHDIRPWWSYWLVLLATAYREFTARALVLAKRRGVKTDLVLDAMKSMPSGFTLRQIQQKVPGCGIELIRKICKAEKSAGRIRCMGRGPNTLWRVKRKHETETEQKRKDLK